MSKCRECIVYCFEITNLLWDLNEDRSNPYIKALRDKNPKNVAEFLSKWNKGRGYKKEKLKKAIEKKQDNLLNMPSKDGVKKTLELANEVLKNATNKRDEEYVGSVKLSHIYHPNLFPLIDNPIVKRFGLNKYKKFNDFCEHYILFKNSVDAVIKDFGIRELIINSKGIYKLMDEILYLFITQKRYKTIKDIFTLSGNRWCIFFIEDIINKLEKQIKLGIERV